MIRKPLSLRTMKLNSVLGSSRENFMNACVRSLLALAIGTSLSNGASAVSGAALLYPDWGMLGAGRVIEPFDVMVNGADSANDVVGLPDGSVFLVGQAGISTSTSDFGIFKLRPDGTPDTMFGSFGNGHVVYSSAFADVAYAAAIDAEGRLLVAGSRKTAQNNSDFLVCRFNAATGASVVFTGGSASCVAVAFDLPAGTPTNRDVANDIVLDDAGRITLVGIAEATGGDIYGAVARLLPNGAADMSFGSGGRTFFRNLAYTQLNLFSAQYASNGKLIAVGQVIDANSQKRAVVARLTEEGQVDPLGINQQYSFRVINQDTGAGDMALVDNPTSEEDSVILVGRAGNPVQAFIAKVRTDSPGLDVFGTSSAGYSLTDFGGSSAYFDGIVREPNGGFIAVGQACVTTCAFSIARYKDNGMPDADFATPNGENRLTFTVSTGNSSAATSAFYDGHGGLLVGGRAVSGGTQTDQEFAVAKFLTDTLFTDRFDD